jgi:hypothetical protein
MRSTIVERLNDAHAVSAVGCGGDAATSDEVIIAIVANISVKLGLFVFVLGEECSNTSSIAPTHRAPLVNHTITWRPKCLWLNKHAGFEG